MKGSTVDKFGAGGVDKNGPSLQEIQPSAINQPFRRRVQCEVERYDIRICQRRIEIGNKIWKRHGRAIPTDHLYPQSDGHVGESATNLSQSDHGQFTAF